MAAIGNRPAEPIGHIVLIGFSGSGKSSVGPLLARALKRPFADSDRLIEKRTGMQVHALFATQGENYFRAQERIEIERLCRSSKEPYVIAIGGGAVKQKPVRDLLRRTAGAIIWLRCSIAETERRLRHSETRPLLSRLSGSTHTTVSSRTERIRTLLQSRLRFYEMADLVVSTTGKTPLQIARQINGKLRGN